LISSQLITSCFQLIDHIPRKDTSQSTSSQGALGDDQLTRNHCVGCEQQRSTSSSPLRNSDAQQAEANSYNLIQLLELGLPIRYLSNRPIYTFHHQGYIAYWWEFQTVSGLKPLES